MVWLASVVIAPYIYTQYAVLMTARRSHAALHAGEPRGRAQGPARPCHWPPAAGGFLPGGAVPPGYLIIQEDCRRARHKLLALSFRRRLSQAAEDIACCICVRGLHAAVVCTRYGLDLLKVQLSVHALRSWPAEHKCRHHNEHKLCLLDRPRTTMRLTTAPSWRSTTVRAVVQRGRLADARRRHI
jgi:hypothetical protein